MVYESISAFLTLYAAGWFVSIFHSFEAGIANANSSFKWRKKCPFMKNSHLQNLIIWLTEHQSQTFLLDFSSVSFDLIWNLLETASTRVRRKYTNANLSTKMTKHTIWSFPKHQREGEKSRSRWCQSLFKWQPLIYPYLIYILGQMCDERWNLRSKCINYKEFHSLDRSSETQLQVA